VVLISMVGDFDSNILPLFFHYAESVDVHILLYDSRHSDRMQAGRLFEGIKRFCVHYDYNPAMYYLAYDEDSVSSIQDVFEQIKRLGGNDRRLWLNASDGLASTLAILQPLIRSHNGVILAYDRIENSCNVLEGDTMRQERVAPMTITEHLMLKNIGYELLPEDPSFHKRKDVVFELMERTDLYLIFRGEYEKNRDNLNKSHRMYKRKLESIGKANDMNYIRGTIFEEYCYWLVHDLGFDDVQLGTKVTHLPDTDDAFFNELDLLLIKDNHLHIIECKLRKHVNGEEFIYKYDSVGNLLDADGRRMIVSVGGKNVDLTRHGNRNVQFNESNIRRARKAQISIYQAERMDPLAFQNQVKSFLLDNA